MDKKQLQLGMNPSTAQQRLLRDLLYKLIVETDKDVCFHCGKPLSRETFSIEHKKPWLDSKDPKALFFNLDNIAFSHHSCNVGAARKPNQKYYSREEKRFAANESQNKKRQEEGRVYDSVSRREKYLRNGT